MGVWKVTYRFRLKLRRRSNPYHFFSHPLADEDKVFSSMHVADTASEARKRFIEYTSKFICNIELQSHLSTEYLFKGSTV